MAHSFRRDDLGYWTGFSPASTNHFRNHPILVDDPMDLDTEAYYAEVRLMNAMRDPVNASSWSSPSGSPSPSPPQGPPLLEGPSTASRSSVELSSVPDHARESVDKSESCDTTARKRHIEELLWRQEQNRHHLREIDQCWGRGWNVNNPNIYPYDWEGGDIDPGDPLGWDPSLMEELSRLARLTRGRAEEIVPELEHYLLAEGMKLSERGVGLFADMVENLPMGPGHFDLAAMLDMCHYSMKGVPGGRHVRWSDL